MTERWVRAATAAVALVGVGIASYLSYTRITDTAIICPTSGCGSVQRSDYAELLGIPVAYLGVLGYAAIAATTLVAGRRGAVLGSALAIVAAGFAGYLLLAQLAFIHAVCTWCVGSDVVAAFLLVLSFWRLRLATTARPGRVVSLPA